MILEWKIKCDVCGKIIDAKKETFHQAENGEWCDDCDDSGAMP